VHQKTQLEENLPNMLTIHHNPNCNCYRKFKKGEYRNPYSKVGTMNSNWWYTEGIDNGVHNYQQSRKKIWIRLATTEDDRLTAGNYGVK
jgi:hypothetical protein